MIFFSPPQLTSRTKAKEQALPPNTPYNIPKRGRTSLRDSPPGQEIPRDKKFPGTRNLPGQEIPRDKKSPGTRNPPGQEFPRDKKSPGTRNPRDKKSPGTRHPPGQKSPGKSRAGTASIYIKEWQFYSFLPYLLLQYWS